jgi:polyhydroxyalkanoate synthesis repressor PhaR
MPENSARADLVLIKRYPNRRLYNTVSATYLSLDDLSNMILGGERFVVRDAETGADITRDILERLH